MSVTSPGKGLAAPGVQPRNENAASWRPLLDGDEAERAWAVVHAVAEELRPEPERTETPTESGFSDGSADFALFFAYLAHATGDRAWSACADSLLDQAIDDLAERPLPPMLHGGFPGIGWTIEHVTRSLAGEGAETGEDHGSVGDEDPISEALIEFLGRPAAPGDFDLISGLAGLGVYALEALPRPAARRCLELVVDRLAEIAETAPGGVTWFTPLDQVPPHHREHAPHGYYNLGVAHGLPGVVSMLGACTRTGVLTPDRRSLLDGAVDWLLSLKQEGSGWCFPSWVGEGVRILPARLAWCYGDPGIAAALLTAARHAGRRTWEAEALEIARRAAARPPESSGVRDAGLCHGSAGLGHLFNRMYQASGDPTLADAAHHWFRHTLGLWRPGRGVGGFVAYSAGEDGEDRWRTDPGFLMGSAGVALALLAAVTSLEPAWDRALAVSVPLAPQPPAPPERA